MVHLLVGLAVAAVLSLAARRVHFARTFPTLNDSVLGSLTT